MSSASLILQALLLAAQLVWTCDAEPLVGWYMSERGDSCDERCAAIVGGSFVCDSDRMRQVTNDGNFNNVLVAIGADQGTDAVATCPDYWGALSTLELQELAPDFQVGADGSGGCHKSTGASTCDASVYWANRLCCCKTSGMDAATVCPVVSTDCGTGTWWDPTTKRCVLDAGCPTPFWRDTANAKCIECPAHASSVSGATASTQCFCDAGFWGVNGGTCTACPIGTFGDAPSQTTQAAGCNSAAADCDQGTYGASLVATGMTACSACPLHLRASTPAGSMICRAPLSRWYFAHANSSTMGGSCDAVCDAVVGTSTCHAERMSAVQSADALLGVVAAITVELGPGAAPDCSAIGTGESPSSYAPYFNNPGTQSTLGDEKCYYRGSAASSSCSIKAGYQHARLCCCVPFGEDARTACPVVAENCGAGTAWDSASFRCLPCPTGRFQKTPGTAQPCEECEVGRYQRDLVIGNVDALHCADQCPQGRFSNRAGLTSVEGCEGCSGESVAGPGATECTECAGGQIPDASNASCVSCSIGMFKRAMISRPVCEPCPTGQVAGLQSDTCATCEGGQVPDASNALCVSCGVGRFKSGSGFVCEQCSSGRYAALQSDTCLECNSGQVPDAIQAACVTAASLNKNCIAGQKIIGESECANCLQGTYSDRTDLTECLPCGLGHAVDIEGATACNACEGDTATGVNFTASTCESCPDGEIPDAVHATCSVCAIGSYRARTPRSETSEPSTCTQCPSKGMKCAGGIIALDLGTWFDPSTADITIETEIHSCFNDECCSSKAAGSSSQLVSCNAKLGYKGPLCGACRADEGFVRTGFTCSKCATPYIDWLVLAALVSCVAVFTVYIAAFRKTHRKVGEYGGIIRRIAFSYMQMLGVLGIFKARGTKAFNDAIGKSSQVAGGAITSIQPIKCLLSAVFESPAYAPFLLNMAMPLVFAASVALIMIPTTACKRLRERHKSQKAVKMAVRRGQGAIADRLEEPFVPPRYEPIVDLQRKCGGLPLKIAITTPCCRKSASDEYIANAKRYAEGQSRLAPKYRSRLDISDRALGGIPAALLRACACCRVEMKEEERRTWRSKEALHDQKKHFKPLRRFVAVMVLVMYSLYPTLVASIASLFSCSDLIGGKRYLLGDLNVTCYEGWHIVYVICASAGLVIYCLGTPIALALLIVIDCCTMSTPTPPAVRLDLDLDRAGEAADDAGGREGGVGAGRSKCVCICALRSSTPWGFRTASFRERYGLLVAGYGTMSGPIVMAWEPLVVMLRKLFITLAGSLLRDPYIQIISALAILVASLTIQALVQPYESALLNVLDVASLLALVFTQVLSIVYLYLDSLPDAELPLSRNALEVGMTAALSAANVGIVAILFAAWIARLGYEKLLTTRRKVRKARKATAAAARANDDDGEESGSENTMDVEMTPLRIMADRGASTVFADRANPLLEASADAVGFADFGSPQIRSAARARRLVAARELQVAEDASSHGFAAADDTVDTIGDASGVIARVDKEASAEGSGATAATADGAVPPPSAHPRGWTERKSTGSGERYYVNDHTEETTWEKPTLPAPPSGWAVSADPNGNVYYANVSTGESHWDHPHDQ